MNSQEFQRLARAYLALAMEAKNDVECMVLLEMANTWNQAALRTTSDASAVFSNVKLWCPCSQWAPGRERAFTSLEPDSLAAAYGGRARDV